MTDVAPNDPAGRGAALEDVRPRRSIRKNLAALFASQSSTWLLSTALLVLQPRLLGPAALGDLRIAASIWAILAVFNTWGTTTLLTIEVAQDSDQARPLSRAVVRLRIVLLLAIVPAVAGFILLAGYPGRVDWIIAVVGVSSVVGIAAGSNRAALLGLEQMAVVGRYDVLNEVLTVFFIVSALLLGAGALQIALLGIAFAAWSTWLFDRGLRKNTRATQAPSVRSGRALLRAATPYLFVDATLIIYLQIDTIVISLVVGETELGWYSTADTLFGSLLFVPTIVMTALFPTFARMHHQTSEQASTLLEQVFRSLLVLGVWIGVGTVVVSDSFTHLLFGQQFAQTAPVLAVFGVVTIISYQTILLGTFAVTTGRAKVWSTLMVISIIVSVPLDLVLVPFCRTHFHNGAIGGAGAYIVTELFQLVAGIIWLAPSLLSRRTVTRLARVMIAGVALFAAGWPFRRMIFLVPATIGSIAYLTAIALLRTADPYERDAIAKIVWKVRRGTGGPGEKGRPPVVSPS